LELSKNPGLGPGAYDPNYKITKKTIPATDWAASKVSRPIGGDKESSSPTGAKKTLNQGQLPGPGSYEVGAAGKIGGQVTKDVAEIEKRKLANSFNHYKLLQYKMNLEKYNYDEKKQKHID
jgi:hypothetical protein